MHFSRLFVNHQLLAHIMALLGWSFLSGYALTVIALGVVHWAIVAWQLF